MCPWQVMIRLATGCAALATDAWCSMGNWKNE